MTDLTIIMDCTTDGGAGNIYSVAKINEDGLLEPEQSSVECVTVKLDNEQEKMFNYKKACEEQMGGKECSQAEIDEIAASVRAGVLRDIIKEATIAGVSYVHIQPPTQSNMNGNATTSYSFGKLA